MSPGPSVALIIRNSVRFSRAAGVLTAIGHACGIGIYASLAILGLHFILTTNLFIFNAIQIIGSIFLLGLGIMFIIDRSTGLQIEETQKNHNSFFQGLIIAIINPKILIWFTAIFSNFITINSSTITNFILVITPTMIDGIWYVIVAIIVTSYGLKEFFQEKKIAIQKISGSLLIIISLSLLINLFNQ
tara:strand:- start:218 stop:781 length:564 start_codon:yes stop_codon:yes gene_type:complete